MANKDDPPETIVECSWQRIAAVVKSHESPDPETVHASLIELDPQWKDQALPLAVELCGFAYGQLLDRARQIAAAQRVKRLVSEREIDDLRLADDVLDVVRTLFERYEPNALEIQPSLN
jgi:hypothetical protein